MALIRTVGKLVALHLRVVVAVAVIVVVIVHTVNRVRRVVPTGTNTMRGN